MTQDQEEDLRQGCRTRARYLNSIAALEIELESRKRRLRDTDEAKAVLEARHDLAEARKAMEICQDGINQILEEIATGRTGLPILDAARNGSANDHTQAESSDGLAAIELKEVASKLLARGWTLAKIDDIIKSMKGYGADGSKTLVCVCGTVRPAEQQVECPECQLVGGILLSELYSELLGRVDVPRTKAQVKSRGKRKEVQNA